MHAPVHRCLAVWLVATLGIAALVGWLLPVALTPASRFDDMLVRGCAAVGAAAAAWLWLLTSAVVVEAATGARSGGIPAPLRRAVLAACGVAVVVGLAAPVQATPGEQHRDRQPSLSGLPLPDRAVGGARVAVGPVRHHATPSAAQPAQVVVVQPGDALWDIARADLGPDTEAAAIDARWREIYAANRSVIGPDPDLIQPAQRLRLPAH